jgi:hypothetical protein
MPPTTSEIVSETRDRLAIVDAHTRPKTALEERMLDFMCHAIAKGRSDCCYANKLAQDVMAPFVEKVRPGVNFEDYE